MFQYHCRRCDVEFATQQRGDACPVCHTNAFLAVSGPAQAPTNQQRKDLNTGSSARAIDASVANQFAALAVDDSQAFDKIMRNLLWNKEELDNALRTLIKSTSDHRELQRIESFLAKLEKFLATSKTQVGQRKGSVLTNGNNGPSTSVHVSSLNCASIPPVAKASPQLSRVDGVSSKIAATFPQVRQASSQSEPKKTQTEADVPSSEDISLPRNTNIFSIPENASRIILLPSISTATTEDSLRDFFASSGFEVQEVNIRKWNDGQSRGSAVVAFAHPRQAHQLARNCKALRIDNWPVQPKLLLTR